MKTILLAMLVTFLLTLGGCAGIDIHSISPDEATAAHKGSTLPGYIVYAPMVVVEVAAKDVCVRKDKSGNCTYQETRCSAGAPFLLPDYSKPFLVRSKSGFGKAGADITIVDGWRLGAIKDNSDNTAILGAIASALGTKSFVGPSKPAAGGCDIAGLYRVNSDSTRGITLQQILSYPR